jgi:hypothetical protein
LEVNDPVVQKYKTFKKQIASRQEEKGPAQLVPMLNPNIAKIFNKKDDVEQKVLPQPAQPPALPEHTEDLKPTAEDDSLVELLKTV